MLVTKFTRANLEDWLTDIFLNYQILNMILVIHEGVRLENSKLSFEGSNDDFILFGVEVIIYVGNAD